VTDRALSARLSAGAIEHSSRFSWAATAAATVATYRDAVDELAETAQESVG
jgi:hypothetical protein